MATKNTSENWYQSRTIQAALIGAGVLVFVSIVSWLITLYANKLEQRTHLEAEPSVESQTITDSSPDLPKEPNSDLTIGNSTSTLQQLNKELIEPEEREADVNRPLLSPIIKIQEEKIPPEGKEGTIAEIEKEELIKKDVESIKPEDK